MPPGRVLQNGSNTLSIIAAGTPGPRSATQSFTCPACSEVKMIVS